jgi:uncharacterized repeat protein (TIGR01451 family)
MSKKLFISIFAILFVSLLFTASPVLAEEQFLPGDIITYTIGYQNEGNQQAQNIIITQPIPDGTTYVAGSLIIDGLSQTDAKDGDNADYNETVAGSVYFLIPNVPPDDSGYVSFQVEVGETPPEQIEGQASAGYDPPESETSSEAIVLYLEGEEPPTCTPNWQCTEWSECIDDVQTRTCTDLNNCGTEEGKPAESQACGEECTPNWQCDEWSECIDDVQTRTCTDVNSCGSEEGKPAESQACEIVCTPNWQCGAWSDCIDESQTRSCWDVNDCGTISGRPALEQVCGLPCSPAWQCDEWSECIDDVQTRTCTDLNYCGTDEGKPAESKACGEECMPNWQCDEWSECVDNLQTRTCRDLNICDIEETELSESRSCGIVCTPNWQCTEWSECVDRRQTRTCQDLNECDTEEGKLAESRACGPLGLIGAGITEFLEGLTQRFGDLAKFHQEQIRENEPLQKINKRAALPAVSVAVVANTLASIPLAAAGWPIFQYLFQLIHFLFTQPAYLFAKRRRYWGTVYNALSKQPIGLAVVRLYDAVNKKLVTTRVTGPDGRYFFLAEAEKDYYIEIKAPGFTFPSKYLAGKSEDGTYEELYHGKTIRFSRGKRPFIHFNIPLDSKEGEVYISPFMKPVKTKIVDLTSFLGLSSEERKKEDKRILTAFSRKKASALFAHLGPVLAFICLVLSPALYTFILFLVHICFLLLFRHLAQGRGPKPWGEVFDKKSEQRLVKAIVRLFDTQYGKLLLSNVTKKGGRYGFLVGNDKYVLTCEREKYRLPEEKVEIQGQREGMVRKDLGMEKR